MVDQIEFQFCPFCGKKVKNLSEWLDSGNVFETRWLCEDTCKVGGINMVVFKTSIDKEAWEEWLQWDWNYPSTVPKLEN